MLPREIADHAVSDLLRRRIRRQQRQPLAGAIVPHRHVRGTREHVHRLRERDRRDERERDDAVRPPGCEVRARRLLRRHAQSPEPAADRPPHRRPLLERRLRLRDAECLEQKAAQREKEQRAEERPVANHVASSVLLAIRARVVEAAWVQRTLHRHDREPERERDPEDVEHERVAEIERAAPEVEPEERLCDVVLEREDPRPDEQHDEAVEDQHVADAGERVAPLDPAMREDDRARTHDACRQPAQLDVRAAAPVPEHEPRDAPEEDRRRHDDQAVPEDDLPVGEAREGLACFAHTSFASSSATSKRSATAP